MLRSLCLRLVLIAVLGSLVVSPAVNVEAMAQSQAECDDRVWDEHLGRTALYTMYPAGQLTARGTSSPTTDFQPGLTYLDEAGNEWLVFENGDNQFHQPAWFDRSTPEAEPWPNLKFVAVETALGTTGSYEAILQPDGEDSYSTAPRDYGPFTYGTLNWLKDGSLVGTYNYYDAGEHPILHAIFDVIPHIDDNYAPALFVVDPRGDWQTYQTRMQSTLDDLLIPSRIVPEIPEAQVTLAPDASSPSGWSVRKTSGELVRPVDADLVDAVRYVAGCNDLLACDHFVPAWEGLANSSTLFGLRDGEPVQLVDGHYEERFDSNGLLYTEVLDLSREWMVVEDLDGDCLQDALAIITWSGGASGVFYDLIVLRNTGDNLAPVNRLQLGDRIEVERMSAGGGQLTLDLITKAPSDPACCPSRPETKVLSYDELLKSTTESSQPAPESPAGTGSVPIGHDDVMVAIGHDEPNIFYTGSCAGDVIVQEYPAPAGATPFCGTIVSSSPTEAVVELAEEFGLVTITLVNTDDGWRVDWDRTR